MKRERTPVIVVFTTSYLPEIGGAELAIHHITKRIPEIRFVIITSRFSKKFPRNEISGSVEIRRVGFGIRLDKYLLPFFGAFVARLYIKNGVALFWGMMISQGTIAAYFLKKFYPAIPLVVTLQEGDSEQHIERKYFGLIWYFWKRVLSVADRVTAISTYLERRARHAGFKGIVTLVPNGVDERYVSESFERAPVEELKDELDIKKEERVIISVSRLTKKNGLKDLIDAVALLKKDGMQVRLLLVGDGEDKGMLKERAMRLGLTETVLFLGARRHEELLRYYRMSDVFARPSHSEGLGIAFLEAMGAGVPIIATRVGGIVDFLEDAVTGVFVDVGAPENIARGIKKILDNKEFADQLRYNARELIIQKYLWVDITENMRRVFAEYGA